MTLLTRARRCVRTSVSTIPVLIGAFALATTLGFASHPNPETIQATYSQAGKTIGITLIVYNYSTPSELQVLSSAFQEGKDRALATALSKIKAVGQCTISGAPAYDVAFIQTVLTPTGRQIVFITSRPRPFDESDPPGTPQSFDLAVGQFDLNDADPAKSTGFLFPASKLVIDEQGEFHYDLAGIPWALVDVLDSKGDPLQAEARGADATGHDFSKNLSPSVGH